MVSVQPFCGLSLHIIIPGTRSSTGLTGYPSQFLSWARNDHRCRLGTGKEASYNLFGTVFAGLVIYSFVLRPASVLSLAVGNKFSKWWILAWLWLWSPCKMWMFATIQASGEKKKPNKPTWTVVEHHPLYSLHCIATQSLRFSFLSTCWANKPELILSLPWGQCIQCSKTVYDMSSWKWQRNWK